MRTFPFSYLAPRAMLDQFLKDLRDRGLKLTQEVNEEESAIRYRLSSRPP